MYTQCKLKRGNLTTTSWILSFIAHKNRKVRIKVKCDSLWENWTVVEVFNTRATAPDHRKSIRGHRKKTGDSNAKPKN